MERNGRVLNTRYPGYDAMIAEFVAADPLLDARRAIDMHRLTQAAVRPVLLVTCNLPGGVKRHVDSRQADLIAEGCTVLVLQPSQAFGAPGQALDQVRVSAPDRTLKNLVFNLPQDLPVLRALLLQLRLENIELHHFLGLPPAVLDLLTGLGSRYEVYVHDYLWICPRVTLANGDGFYCGEPALEDCEACVRKHGTALEESLTVAALRERSARIIAGASAIIAPSNDVRTRLGRYFPDSPVTVTAWETPIENRAPHPPEAAVTRVRVAVIGAISVPKGYQVLLECARDAAARNLDLDFVVIGYTDDDERLRPTGRVFITGPYADHEVGELLAREQCHIAFFPSVVPETWCYALSHALAHRLPIVAFDLGAIAERLRSHAAVDLLPLFTSATETNNALLRSAQRISASKEPAMDTASMDTASISNNPAVADGLATSIQFLPLPEGIYILTVKDGAPSTASPEELTLPAVQVGVAPATAEGKSNF